MSPPTIARLLALGAGSLDFCTGLGLVFLPETVLPLMHVPAPEGDALVYLRFVGAFVGAVGACYLWALVFGGLERLRHALELTILFRLSAGTFSATAIVLGRLSPAWSSVPVTDFALVVLQLWLVKKLKCANASSPDKSSA